MTPGTKHERTIEVMFTTGAVRNGVKIISEAGRNLDVDQLSKVVPVVSNLKILKVES